ncbi:MAG: hypothetical protein QM668_19065 [Agriterribacter sp.]
MKRKFYFTMLSAFVFILIDHAQAQINAGTGMAGFSFNYSTGKSKTNNGTVTSKSSNTGIYPSYGYFVKQNLVVGGGLAFNNTKYENGNSTNDFTLQKRNGYGVNIFARQYKNLGSSGFYLFLQGAAGADLFKGENKWQGSSSNIYTNRKEKGVNIQLSLSPGISYAVTPMFHIETGLNNLVYAMYSNAKADYINDPSSSIKSNNFNIGANIGANTEWSIGARLLFGGKK